MSKVDHAAEISVYDGPDSRGNLLTTIRVKNETFPQSVTSTRDTIYLEFKAKPSTKLLFYVDLFAGKGEIFLEFFSLSLLSLPVASCMELGKPGIIPEPGAFGYCSRIDCSSEFNPSINFPRD